MRGLIYGTVRVEIGWKDLWQMGICFRMALKAVPPIHNSYGKFFSLAQRYETDATEFEKLCVRFRALASPEADVVL